MVLTHFAVGAFAYANGAAVNAGSPARAYPVSLLPELARALGVSIEDLIVGENAKTAARRGPTSKIERQLEQIRRLPRSKQQFVIEMLDAVLARAARSST